jgi:hypothetical protein
MSDSPKSRVAVPVVTITSQELRDNRNYRIWTVRFDGEIVSETLSQPGNIDIQWLCEKGRAPRPVPAEFRGTFSIPKGRKYVQPTQSQLPQAQAGVHPIFAPILAAIAPAVRPVTVTECFMCDGSGIFTQDHFDGSSSSCSCGNCAGRGYVATEGGEA